MSTVTASKKAKKQMKPKVADLVAKIRARALAANQKSARKDGEEAEVSEEKQANRSKREEFPEDSKHEITSFRQLKLIPELLESCDKLNFTKLTPIQAESIPYALEGYDIIGLAQTGSGKTAAFAIPILQSLWLAQAPYYACILAPTRELAVQICNTFDALGSNVGLRCVTLVGGMDMMAQVKDLMRKPHVIVATPGRLMDHLEHTKGFSLRALKYLVMDEADRLLDMDFGPALDKILKIIPKERTTYLFSATMTSKIEKLQRASLSNPINVTVSDKHSTVDTLIQRVIVVPISLKDTVLIYLLNANFGKSMIIFTRTCAHAQRTAILARSLEFGAIPLHGDLSQAQRLGALNKFKSGERQILVATDVAARGLDFPSVDIVINYDIPTDSKAYIHRVGRTARAGRSGKSVSLVTPYDLEHWLRIEKAIGMKIPVEEIEKDAISSLRNIVDRATAAAVRQTKDFHDRRKGFNRHNRGRNDAERSFTKAQKICRYSPKSALKV